MDKKINWMDEEIAVIHNNMNKEYFSKNEAGKYDIYKFLEKGFLEIISQESTFPLTCIDLGCGAGWQALYLENVGLGEKIKYIGVDISKHMCELGKKNYPKGNFIVGDINDFVCEPQILIMSCGVIESFQNWEQIINKHFDISNKWVFLHKIFTVNEETYVKSRVAYKEDLTVDIVYINIDKLQKLASDKNFSLYKDYKWDYISSFIFRKN